MENLEPKRKSRTSSAASNRYKAKTYTRLVLQVKKEIAAEYKEKCNELDIPYSQPLHEAIEKFLKENKNSD